MTLPAPTLPPESNHRARVSVALPPGAATLLGQPTTGGFTWAGRFPHQAAAIVALLRRALSVDDEGDW